MAIDVRSVSIGKINGEREREREICLGGKELDSAVHHVVKYITRDV